MASLQSFSLCYTCKMSKCLLTDRVPWSVWSFDRAQHKWKLLGMEMGPHFQQCLTITAMCYNLKKNLIQINIKPLIHFIDISEHHNPILCFTLQTLLANLFFWKKLYFFILFMSSFVILSMGLAVHLTKSLSLQI